MKTKTFLLFCLIIGIIIIQLSAQENNKKTTIKGTVLDVDSMPVVNAMVMIDGQKTNMVTNAQGNYRIKVKPDAVSIGIVSFGHGMIQEEIAGRNQIDFSFNTQSVQQKHQTNTDVPSGNAIVNTGYDKERKEDLTTSISKVDGTNPKRSYTTIYQMLQEVPGVQVNGESVVIQDARNTFGYVHPLFILDGVPVESINDISPATIESIEVLKANAAAIYGTRGYGGAILITTKTANNSE